MQNKSEEELTKLIQDLSDLEEIAKTINHLVEESQPNFNLAEENIVNTTTHVEDTTQDLTKASSYDLKKGFLIAAGTVVGSVTGLSAIFFGGIPGVVGLVVGGTIGGTVVGSLLNK